MTIRTIKLHKELRTHMDKIADFEMTTSRCDKTQKGSTHGDSNGDA